MPNFITWSTRSSCGSGNRNVEIMKPRLPLPIFVSVLLASQSCSHLSYRNSAEPLRVSDLAPVEFHKIVRHRPVEIVEGGRPLAKVFVAETRQTQTFSLLVSELVETVRLSTGAELEVADVMPPADQPAIVIGDCADSRKAGIDPDEIPVEGFVVKTAPNRVYLVGSTRALPPGSERWARWENDGTAWAVADFMERFVGVRWYWPATAGGRSIVKTHNLEIPPAHYSDQPAFRLREYYPPRGWKLPTRARSSDREPLPFPSGAIPDGVNAIDMATYLPLVRSGCSWPYKIKVHQPQGLGRRPAKWLEERKAMFAVRKDGTRNFNMLCYSSPKTLEFLLGGCEMVWDKGGRCPWVTSTCVTVSPADSAVECHCPACRETYAKGGGTWIEGNSLIMGLFARRMCEAVKQRWPDKKVIYLPYWNYQECPREVEYPDNLVVMAAMTTYPMPLNAQPENFQEAMDRLRAWRAKACLPVTVWDYGVGWTYGPYQYPHVVRDFNRAVKDICAGTFINGDNLGEWTNTAPTFYVWMKVLWNPELDVDAVLDEMCRRLYGKAAATARELMRLECELWEAGDWKSRRVKVQGGWYVPASLFGRFWTPDIVQQMKALRNKALAELANDPVARQRFLYWTWTFDAFLKETEETLQKATR